MLVPDAWSVALLKSTVTAAAAAPVNTNLLFAVLVSVVATEVAEATLNVTVSTEAEPVKAVTPEKVSDNTLEFTSVPLAALVATASVPSAIEAETVASAIAVEVSPVFRNEVVFAALIALSTPFAVSSAACVA